MSLWSRCVFVSGLAVIVAGLCVLCPEQPALAALRRAEQPMQGRAPEFPWTSFQRFWNIRCLPGCEIQDPQYVDGRYVVLYGHAISLEVRMEEDIVRSVTARFMDPKGAQGGGQRWLKLVDSIISVGTFRWPEPRIAQTRERFTEISQQTAAYKWQTSWFRRSYDPVTGWEFTLDLLPYVAADGD
ncbi:MAG: hypothetical protein LBC10_02340 [Deltaproteobacteria bacterium]|nr:hypothetical protein [Deltaproteobacteria bacterium]